MGAHLNIWKRYFDDFLKHKLRLRGLPAGEAISQKILYVLFSQMHEQEALTRITSLHTYHLDLVKMANVLRVLDQIQQVGACFGE